MNRQRAEAILRNPERFAHNERIFLNNLVVTMGLGLAPMIIVTTNTRSALMMAAAVALLLLPTRVLASFLLRRVENSLLWRGVGYCGIAGVVYAAEYLLLARWFGSGLLGLGIYLPMLVTEPLIVYRFTYVPESVGKALRKSLQITTGYAILLVITGCVRELAAYGTILEQPILRPGLVPVASMPAGGFIFVGLVCAGWRAAASSFKRFLVQEARNQVMADHILTDREAEQ